jgi:dTDP-4-amino-4,6-dideoxygalactose transaminase
MQFRQDFCSTKLPHLAEWNAQRREPRRRVQPPACGEAKAITLPHEPSWSRAVYHLYVIRTADREGLMNHLKKAGIGTGFTTRFPCICKRPMPR